MEQTPSALQSTNGFTPEMIARLKKQAEKSIVMEADIKTVVSVFSEVIKAFGLQDVAVSGGSINSALPVIINKLSAQMFGGGFNTQALADLQAVMPIIEKYKYLASDEQ